MTLSHTTPVEPPHADVDYLGDYLDGALSSDQRDAVDEHLGCCEACRARLGALRLLVERAAHAPAGIDPGDDLWPDIRTAIESRRTLALPLGAGARPAERPRPWRVAIVVLAGAAAIAALSSLVTMRVVRSHGAAVARVAPAAPVSNVLDSSRR